MDALIRNVIHAAILAESNEIRIVSAQRVGNVNNGYKEKILKRPSRFGLLNFAAIKPEDMYKEPENIAPKSNRSRAV
jgi:hypothetical protein